MRHILQLIIAAVAVIGMSAYSRGSAQAAPAGAATSQVVFQQSCMANGLVQAGFLWAPSGWGPQFVDVSHNAGFAGWANSPALAAGQNFFVGFALQPNTIFYSRIGTWAGTWLISDTIAFQSISCAGAFSPPSGLSISVLSANRVRLSWNAGTNNFWYCIDTALNTTDLQNLTGSWSNHGCGTTATVVDVLGLACGTGHVARVWAFGPGTGGYSNTVSFTTSDCSFSVPTNLRSTVLSSISARLAWDAGAGNVWYCADTAKSLSDLNNFTGTYRGHGCGTTATTVDATGLDCNSPYYWRVFAQGASTWGHSASATFTTSACDAFTVPTNLDTDDVTKTSATFEWTAGVDNRSFCLDVAKSLDDLRNFGPTFKNYACGTTNKSVAVSDLTCNTTYFWRVFARGTSTSGHSAEATFKTKDC